MSRPAKALWSLTAAYWATIFVLSHLPRVPRIPLAPADKIGHFIAYFVLGALLFLSMSLTHSRRETGWLVLAICSLYAIIDELLQIPAGRFCEFNDWTADVAGAALAALLLTAVKRHRENSDQT